MDTTALLLDTAERIFGDHCDKAALDRAEQGVYPRDLCRIVSDHGLPMLATPEMGGDLADVFKLIRVAGRHAIPLPFSESLIAHHLTAIAGCGGCGPLLTLGVADSSGGEGAEVNVRLEGVPWARAVDQVCYVIGDPVEVVILDVADCDVVQGKNLAGEPRDGVSFVGVPRRCGSAPAYSVEKIFQLMALSRCALMSGALERVLGLSVGYAEERQQFGRPIGKFQAVQHQLAVLAGEVAAALRATDAAVARIAEPGFDMAVAAAKARVGEAAGIGAEIAHQVHGAMGYTHEHRLHHYTRRLLAWRDEYGRETYWQQRLGRAAAARGADQCWDFIVGG